MQPRRARRTDANQTEVVKRFRAWGLSVHAVNGAFDLLVSCGGPSYPVEVKNPAQPPSKRRLTPCEAEFHQNYKGKIFLVETDADVDAAAEEIRAHWLRANGVG